MSLSAESVPMIVRDRPRLPFRSLVTQLQADFRYLTPFRPTGGSAPLNPEPSATGELITNDCTPAFWNRWRAKREELLIFEQIRVQVNGGGGEKEEFNFPFSEIDFLHFHQSRWHDRIHNLVELSHEMLTP